MGLVKTVLTGAMLLAACVPAGASKSDDRPLLIPVEPLGFQALPVKFMSTLSTMFTVNFVDDQHLLFTFTKRSLMPRLPDAEEADEDRNVEALLLELPSGKVLARTNWRTRDRDRYLWPLEHGRFLLRIRSRLSVIDPLRELAKGQDAEAFHQKTFLEFKRPIGYISVAPGGDLLGVETLPPRKPKASAIDADAAALANANGDAPVEMKLQKHGPPPVQIYFFRLAEEKVDGSAGMVARAAGMIGAPNLISLPATADGFLDINKESAQSWVFDFVSHSGKRLELAPYETSCGPRPFFISRSEFLAFGCRGGSDRLELSYFNMKGEEPWLSVLSGSQVSPSIIGAPALGRFAMSRTLTNGPMLDPDNLTIDDLTAQEITVQQNHDGRVLLKVLANPIQRAGQNFDLSPSGEQFAVLRGANLEIYKLPGLSSKDRKFVELAQAMTPEKDEAPVKLNAVAVTVDTGAEADSVAKAAAEAEKPKPAGAVAALPAAESVQASDAQNKAATQAEGALGDAQFSARKPPSLYSAEYPREKGDAPANPGAGKPQ